MIKNRGIHLHPTDGYGERTFYDPETSILGRLYSGCDDFEQPTTSVVIFQEDSATAIELPVSGELGSQVIASLLDKG